MIKRLEQTTSKIRPLMFIVLIALLILIPETMIHFVAVIAHTVYETIAFALEEVLIHGLGLSKFYAQMLVFYGSLAIAGIVTIMLFRRLPSLLAYTRARATESYTDLRTDLINKWNRLPNRHKAQVILIQFVGIFSMMALVLS
jgi:hypothetical protein